MKKFYDRVKSVNYKYFITELFIVVVGILIALTLNNWRENNTDRKREQFYLSSLKTDFEYSLAGLNEILNQNLKSDSSVKNLLVVLRDKNSGLDNESYKKSFSHLFGFNRFVPASGSYKEIISSGNLQVLKNDELRIALSSWDDMIIRNRQLEEVMFWQYHLVNIPYLNKHIARADFYRDNNNELKQSYRTDFKKIFADAEFENILYNRAGALGEANEYLAVMIVKAEHIIELIEEGIEK